MAAGPFTSNLTAVWLAGLPAVLLLRTSSVLCVWGGRGRSSVSQEITIASGRLSDELFPREVQVLETG